MFAAVHRLLAVPVAILGAVGSAGRSRPCRMTCTVQIGLVMLIDSHSRMHFESWKLPNILRDQACPWWRLQVVSGEDPATAILMTFL